MEEHTLKDELTLTASEKRRVYLHLLRVLLLIPAEKLSGPLLGLIVMSH
jgi:hypothetical protein